MKNWIFTDSEKKQIGKRIFAFVLATGLVLGAFPAQNVSATTTDQQQYDQNSTDTTANTAASDATDDGLLASNVDWTPYDITGSEEPTLQAPSVEKYTSNITSKEAEKNLYALTVATGATAGSTVHYFAVRYKDGNGAKRTKYLFPHDDAYQLSYDYMSNKGGVNEAVNSRHSTLDKLGYTISNPSTPEALTTWSVDEYLFKAETGLKSIVGIEVFMTGGSWTVQGMTVSKVTSMSGYGEYGFYSGKYFFGIGKEKIAELTKKKSGTLTLAANGDTLINIGGSDSPYFALSEAKKGSSENTNPFQDVYSIRMDFSDKKDAGIENYLREISAGTGLSDGGVTEDLAVSLEYKDVNGWTRSVVMPVVLSAIGQSMEYGDKVQTIGLCQRGDTIAFTACLPGFASVISTKLYVGSSARSQIEKNCGIKLKNGMSQEQQDAQNAAWDQDSIALAGMSIYSGTCRMSNTEDGKDVKTGETLTSLTTAYSFSEANPMLYYTTTSESGTLINGGATEKITLKEYSSSNPLLGATNNKNFLVRIHTDEMAAAATAQDINIRFTYSTASGTDSRTDNFNVRSQVQDFMGYWPSANNKLGDYAYLYGANANGILEFPISVEGLASFTNVEVSLGSGNDDWQMSGVSVSYIPSIGKIRAYLQNSSASGDSSSYRLVRTIERVDVPPFPLGIQRHFDGTESDSWDVASGSSTGGTDGVDFESMRYSMTYEQTQMNLGFVSSKKTYDVMVTVADDGDSSNANGDSGSSNQFYFQLLFKNGNSAFVLANQQLSSDGFRAGYNETFSVAVNRDYGKLTGVRIIPEDVSENNEIFDKLNISKITVTEQSKGGAAMQYVLDNVGWIGIDYHDEAEDSSIKGRSGRTVAELASKYPVSYQRHVMNLLCEIVTLPWEMEDYMQVEGSVACDIVYIDTEGEPQTISFDVISRMAQYMNKTAISYDPPTDTSDSLSKYYKNMTTVSDPEWMLRPNHTDRFILPSVPNLKSIKSITLYATSRNNKPAQWVIGGINISQIVEDGTVQLTADNEYYRNMVTQPLCQMVSDNEKESMFLPAGEMQSLTLQFSDNELVWSEDDSWVSPVTRLPDGSDDTLNVYVYPSANSRNIDGSAVNLAMQYTRPFANPQQTTDVMAPYGSGTEDACFMATGLRASGLTNINNLSLQCMNARMLFDYGIIQHVREGVIVSTYYVDFNNSSALLGLTAKPNNYTTVKSPRTQTAYISLGTETEEATLFAEQNDIAIAFKYRSSIDHGAAEYYSPYVYFTDAGIGKIYPGLMAEIPFDVPYVTEITGYRIVSFGNVHATVEGALLGNYSYSSKTKDETTGEVVINDLTREGIYSVADINTLGSIVPLSVSNAITEKEVTAVGMTGDNSVNPLDITFTTSGALSTGESGTGSPVQMTFTYLDYSGATRTKIIYDARKYIQKAGASFETGSETRMRLFLPECSELLSIGILPYDFSGNANWSVSTIRGTLSLGSYVFNRTVDTIFTQAQEGMVYLKDIQMNSYVSIDDGASQQITDHLKSMVLSAGQMVKVTVTTTGGSGFNANAYWIVNDTQTDMTGDLITNLSSTGFTFTVPANNTTSPQTYSVVVSSAVNPSIKDVINITIQGVEVSSDTSTTTDSSNTGDSNTTDSSDTSTETDGSSGNTTTDTSENTSGT